MTAAKDIAVGKNYYFPKINLLQPGSNPIPQSYHATALTTTHTVTCYSWSLKL